MPLIRYGYNGATADADRFTLLPMWQRVHPEIRRRLWALIVATDYRLGVGGTWRSAAAQVTLFRSRYHIVSTVTGIWWDGHFWALNAGMAPAAIPGESYHEPTIGPDGGPDSSDTTGLCVAVDTLNLAACVTAAQLAAHGLRNFKRESWHVQPAEWPAGRRAWNAAPTRLYIWPLPNTTPPTTPPPAPEDDMQFRTPNTRPYDSRQIEHGSVTKTLHTVDFMASAVGVVVHVVSPAAAGYAVVWGAGPKPSVSHLDFAAGQTIANTLRMPLEPGTGRLHIEASTPCHVIVDWLEFA